MKIALLGDIALIGTYSLYNNSKLTQTGWGVERILSECDYVVGNLETPFSYKRKPYGAKSAYLCTEPENIELLKMLGVNAVTLANNHMFDYGKEGYELTKQLLDEAGIEWFGAEGKELKMNILGNKLAFSGWCCYSTNPQGCVKNGNYGINEFDVEEAIKVLKHNANEGWLNIAAVHAGIEHVNYPSLDTIKLADKLSETGPMIYYGHHPHVSQSVERKGNSLIAYSLGNFCFDDTYAHRGDAEPIVKLSESNRESFILKVTIEDNVIKNYEIIPIYIGQHGIETGKGITQEVLDGWQDKMHTLSDDDYQHMRQAQRNEWVRERKARRGIGWLLSHLRPRYAKLFVTNHLNAKKYAVHVSGQL